LEQAIGLIEEPRITILDVRTREEFANGHVQGAVHCPFEDLDQLAESHEMEAPVLVVCAAGVRSAYAAKYLRSRGYAAWTLTGGIKAWLDAGRHVAT
jgi:rhodanese-related sulfurtransferase